MSCRRFFGFRSRQRASKRRTSQGAVAGRAFQSTSCFSTLARTSLTVSPSKSFRPVSISNSTTPKAQMSARLSRGLPRACSGLM